jgi:putative transposase
MGISEQTFYRWKKKYAGLGVSELRRLRQLEEENKQLWLDQFLGEVRSDDYIARK